VGGLHRVRSPDDELCIQPGDVRHAHRRLRWRARLWGLSLRPDVRRHAAESVRSRVMRANDDMRFSRAPVRRGRRQLRQCARLRLVRRRPDVRRRRGPKSVPRHVRFDHDVRDAWLRVRRGHRQLRQPARLRRVPRESDLWRRRHRQPVRRRCHDVWRSPAGLLGVRGCDEHDRRLERSGVPGLLQYYPGYGVLRLDGRLEFVLLCQYGPGLQNADDEHSGYGLHCHWLELRGRLGDARHMGHDLRMSGSAGGLSARDRLSS
jgi:hypothetical protein